MISKALNSIKTPWKITNYLFMRMITPYALLLLTLKRVTIGADARFWGVPVVQKTHGSQIIVGHTSRFRSTKRSNPLVPYHPVLLSTRSAKANIVIGNNFSITGGSLIADESITIGDYVTIGANCRIFDTDFHPIDAEHRQLYPNDAKTAPIVIEDKVFIGTDSLILKGVTIGSGSVIGAGSVVRSSIPPNVIAAGNPAVVIRTISSKSQTPQ